MALIVGTDRGFVTRDQGAERMLKIVRFLKNADRFHGVWPHFLNGNTGKVMPVFGKYDDGGDLIETAFMMQGLLTARQYFTRNTAVEREIRENGVTYNVYEAIRAAAKSVVASSPYFVPGPHGMELLRSLRGRGIDVTVLTNSLHTPRSW